MIADEPVLFTDSIGREYTVETGRPPHEPTAASRANVETLSGYGLGHRPIAAFIGIARETLEKHYAHELELGAIKANVKVAAVQFQRATDLTHPQGTAAAIWWEKTRSGFKEPKQEVGHSGAIGTYDATKLAELTDDDLNRLDELRARLVLAGSRPSDPGGDS